jgi:hypothetical protein
VTALIVSEKGGGGGVVVVVGWVVDVEDVEGTDVVADTAADAACLRAEEAQLAVLKRRAPAPNADRTRWTSRITPLCPPSWSAGSQTRNAPVEPSTSPNTTQDLEPEREQCHASKNNEELRQLTPGG